MRYILTSEKNDRGLVKIKLTGSDGTVGFCDKLPINGQIVLDGFGRLVYIPVDTSPPVLKSNANKQFTFRRNSAAIFGREAYDPQKRFA